MRDFSIPFGWWAFVELLPLPFAPFALAARPIVLGVRAVFYGYSFWHGDDWIEKTGKKRAKGRRKIERIENLIAMLN